MLWNSARGCDTVRNFRCTSEARSTASQGIKSTHGSGKSIAPSPLRRWSEQPVKQQGYQLLRICRDAMNAGIAAAAPPFRTQKNFLSCRHAKRFAAMP